MLPPLSFDSEATIKVRSISPGDVRQLGEERPPESAIGHADTAAVYASVLGIPLQANRVNVTLYPGDTAVVGQYTGPRLPEGATKLPTGASIVWYLVSVE